ncbi:CapA family protein [Reichenbachiella sp.]|uniref:CapA family protein n=1 Tax=Reichenbachiella sp. TaxID=2184521 RepID=UPI00329A499C
MKYSIYLIGLSLLFACSQPGQLRINFTGDVILDRGVADQLAIYGDSMVSNTMKPFLDGDFNLINLETVLTTKAYDSLKRGYRFKQDPKIATDLLAGGVTHASVANNHSFDFDSLGFLATISTLNANGISAIGNGCDPIIVSKRTQEIGILAVSLTSNNSHLCLKSAERVLDRVDEFKADHNEIPLIIYIHWGLEYQQKPEKWQVDLAHRFIDHGVDAVIGHHPHVFQNIDYYKGKPIVYSLGNFLADAYLPNTTQGVMASIECKNSILSLSLTPVDLSSYFPARMNMTKQIQLMLHNLKFSNKVCFYNTGSGWNVQQIEDTNFEEKDAMWLFHVDNQYGIMLSTLSNGLHRLTLMKDGVSQKSMMIHGKLSEIEIADITNDGNQEILLGITKKVNFDPVDKKRLNVFRIEDDGIQTVWLGTKFLRDLRSFSVFMKDQINYLQTSEADSTGRSFGVTYIWDEFGFALSSKN